MLNFGLGFFIGLGVLFLLIVVLFIKPLIEAIFGTPK